MMTSSWFYISLQLYFTLMLICEDQNLKFAFGNCFLNINWCRKMLLNGATQRFHTQRMPFKWLSMLQTFWSGKDLMLLLQNYHLNSCVAFIFSLYFLGRRWKFLKISIANISDSQMMSLNRLCHSSYEDENINNPLCSHR